jgi:hypothetical protein
MACLSRTFTGTIRVEQVKMRLTKKVRATIRSLKGVVMVRLRVAVLAVFGWSSRPRRTG